MSTVGPYKFAINVHFSVYYSASCPKFYTVSRFRTNLKLTWVQGIYAPVESQP